MDINISDFLPIYPSISRSKNDIFNNYDDNFYEAIYKKKEFYEEKLPDVEEIKTNEWSLLKHQKLIARFLSSYTPYDQLLLNHEMGCVDPDTPILMWNGKIKKAYEIEEDDKLIGDDGTCRNVLSIVKGIADMYTVNQQFGDSYSVNGSHILTLKIKNNNKLTWSERGKFWRLEWFDRNKLIFRHKDKHTNGLISKTVAHVWIQKYMEDMYDMENMEDIKQDILEIEMEKYYNLPTIIKRRLVGFKGKCIEWKKKDTKIQPYELGLKLGEDNIINFDCKSLTYDIKTSMESDYNGFYDLSISYNSCTNFEKLYLNISEKDIYQNGEIEQNTKIPNEYIINDKTIRKDLLQGLIDSCGIVDKEYTILIFENYILMKQISFLVKSLGMSCIMKKYMYNSNTYNIIVITDHEITSNIEVTKKSVGEYIGWKIDGNRRFLLGDFTVTHNSGKSCSAIAAIEQVKREENNIKHTLILAPGPGLLDNFVQEIVLKCTGGIYRPQNYHKIRSESERMKSLRMIAKKNGYLFATYGTIAKRIEELKKNIPLETPNREELVYEEVIKKYSNMFIVMDEIHHLRPKEANKEEITNYNEIKNMCRLVKNTKILLMSGTPMKYNIYLLKYFFTLLISICYKMNELLYVICFNKSNYMTFFKNIYTK